MTMWGLLPLVLRVVIGALDPVTITWFRFGAAALLMALWLGLRGEWPRLSGLSRGAGLLLAVATLALAANYLCYLIGLGMTSPANTQVLIQLAPLLLALGGITVFGEHFTRLQWTGFAVLLGGLGLFFGGQLRALAQGMDRYVAGVGMIGLAAVTWAGYGLAQKQLLHSLSSRQVMLLIYAGCALCFSLGARPADVVALGSVELAALCLCALNTLLAYGAFSAALEHWEASRVSAVLSLTPLATLAFASAGHALWPAWVEAERVSAPSLLGAGAVVAGSLLVSLGERVGRRPPAPVTAVPPAPRSG
jgi:drug/metabolite transporter (DMT)-like permease